MKHRDSVLATEHVRRLPGGSQPHLLYGADRCCYVVKFRNNPQGKRILVNELFVNRLARRIGLPVPRAVVVEVRQDMIARSPDLTIETIGGSIACAAGTHFGCELINGSGIRVSTYLSDHRLMEVAQVFHLFAGALVLDKWTGNTDFRQAIFAETARRPVPQVRFIDNGMCFDGEDWAFHEKPAHGVYHAEVVYRTDGCMQDCEPWIQKVQALTADDILRCASAVPTTWYEGEERAFHRLISELSGRRHSVRKLVASSIHRWINRSRMSHERFGSLLPTLLKAA